MTRVSHLSRFATIAMIAMIAALSLGIGACAPSARPLGGSATTASIPEVTLSPSPTIWRFTWSYADETFRANGDGAVRIAPPARARLDFFLKNGSSGGYAILLGDTLLVPGPDLTRRFLPPPTMLWAALGRLELPPAPDTVARTDGDTLRVDVGALRGLDASKSKGEAWRLAFAGTRLARVERIDDGRRVEWMTRRRDERGQWAIQYVHETGRRRLTIDVTDTAVVGGFDESIWRRP